MNTMNFNQVGGFPLTTRILDELQKAFSVFNALGAIAGDKTIILGCETVGANVANGFVVVNNEVLEFRGGAAQTKVKIVEVVENLLFEDNVSKPVIKTRYITFGTGVGTMNWADFQRPIETKAISGLIQRIEYLEARPLVGNIPIGLIAIWGQAAALIPDGWIEHTDLAGRMPVGFSSSDTDFDVVGKFDGHKNKTLSVEEMPEHDHGLSQIRRQTGNNYNHPQSFYDQGWNSASDLKTDIKGGGQSFSIMNPYRVVHFIRYVG